MAAPLNPPDLTYGEITRTTMHAIGHPPRLYWWILLLLSGGIATLAALWALQAQLGMGVSGLNHPVGWGTYIANFVFWIGIGHSGTLISAILYLLRAKWRNAVSRSAEAMTVIAVMTAGLFPMIHLGRVWVFYYILPYPSERQIWPNFTSPLVWDVVAVFTYFTVSLIFFYVGLLPGLAAARDHMTQGYGRNDWRARLFRSLALGWIGSGEQWHHYGRGYLYFAALATPLVISVHSVVSWDFAMGILPGWHSTIFAPYFVAGAIHSGLAMVLVLLVPMRKLLKLERLITLPHLQIAAKLLVFTAAIVAYAYVVEPFVSWYSGHPAERQFIHWQASGSAAWLYWAIFPLNVLAPLTVLVRSVRRKPLYLFFVGAAVVLGMWIERLVIVTNGTSHDFLPHAWGHYLPNIVELGITAGSVAFFFFMYLLFAKSLPVIPIADLKEDLSDRDLAPVEAGAPAMMRPVSPWTSPVHVVATYEHPGLMIQGLRAVGKEGLRCMDAISPVKLPVLNQLLKRRPSPVRWWTLAASILGFVAGYSLAIYAAGRNGLVVGGKPIVALVPFFIVGFELLVLLGSLVNLAVVIIYARLFHPNPPKGYDHRFSSDRFGIVVGCERIEAARVQAILQKTAAEDVHVFA